jgi:hypothetical protein
MHFPSAIPVTVLGAASLAAASPLEKRGLDTQALAKQYFGNDAPWYQDRIPYFQCSDSKIQDVYYYRWKIFRAHQRDLGARGYISTGIVIPTSPCIRSKADHGIEFLDDVGWQLEPWASLNDATGFHIGEGRWLRDRRFSDDYLNHMYNGGNDRHFTDYMADSTWTRFLVDGDRTTMIAHLDAMISLYEKWNDHYDNSKSLYWVEPLADATEYTISSIDASGGKDGFSGGQAFRPSINSYMWANFRAIANIASLAGKSDVSSSYVARAAGLKKRFQDDIWNDTLSHFIDRHYQSTNFVKYWEPIRGRELVGLVPWMFGMPDNNSKYSAAWKHLLNTNELRGSSGMRTVEPSYQYYMKQYRYDGATGLRECQWNGPVWPYQTTQVLLGLANLLNDYSQTVISKSDYLQELRTYTKLHYNNGKLDLEEDYEPDKPGPIVGLPRSHHYFHSGYNDLIISGLVGIRPQAGNSIVVNPMLPTNSDISYFRLQDVPYHGHTIAVQWDADGSHFGQGAGLTVELDGKKVASAATLQSVTAAVPLAPASKIDRSRIAKSIQLNTTQYPKGSASSGNNAANIHDAIDGRIWFWPELPNGWTSDATTKVSQQWYAIDFGKDTTLTGAELAFYTDGNDIALPSNYVVSSWVNGQWKKIVGNGDQLLANGITNVKWSTLTTSKLQLSFTQAAGKKTRLVEFKAF